jgi:hypothetical protein
MKRGASRFRFDSTIILPHPKTSQVTIFIILGIVIVVSLAIFLTTRASNNYETEIRPVHDFVISCLDISGREAIKAIGLSSGYYPLSEYATEDGIAFYVDNRRNLAPTQQTLETSVSEFVDDFMPFCLDNFADFSEISIAFNTMTTNTQIENDKVTLTANFPLTITKGEMVEEIKNFETEIPIRLGNSFEVAQKISNEHLYNDDVCLTCLDNFSEQHDVFINFDDYAENVIIYTIADNSNKTDEKGHMFVFAVRYNEKNNAVARN